MHYYETSPIDSFFGMLTLDEFFCQVQKEIPDELEFIKDSTLNALKETEEFFRYNSMWEGDVRSGPFVFAIPDPDNASYREAFVWKQRNNGTSFIASPCPIPWLEHYRLNKQR